MFAKDEKKENQPLAIKIAHNLFIIIIAAGILYFAIAVYAGSSLTPPAGPITITMNSLEEIYNVLAGTSYVSGATAKSDGNVLEILKCITTKMNGGACS